MSNHGIDPINGSIWAPPNAVYNVDSVAAIPHHERELCIRPRRTRYKHRPIIVVRDDMTGMLEDGTPVGNLTVYVTSGEPSIWVTMDPGRLLDFLCDTFRDDPAWNYQLMQSDNASRVGITRLTRFGYRPPGRRKRCLHTVWAPGDMLRDSTRLELPANPDALLRFALDVREWLQENNLPVPTTLTGIASSLLRDPRFYPEPRGRVPGATNERLRAFLPGVHSELHHPVGQQLTQVVALDQTRAYHRTVQEIPLPDGTTLYARGHYGDPENHPLWIREGDKSFQETLSMPGLFCCLVISRPTRVREHRPPALDFSGERRIYLWSSEIDFIRTQCDARITGIFAAWTSSTPDTGMPHYGKFAETAITNASPYRQKWLKPTLHSVYGLLAATKRGFRTGWRMCKGKPSTWLIGPREIPVRAIEFPATQPATVNVAMLGVVQAAIRARTMVMANELARAGMTITHLHADGLHAAGDLPLIDGTHWRVETRDNLVYRDRVSWTCEQGDVLPGRSTAKRVNDQRHRINVTLHARAPAKRR